MAERSFAKEVEDLRIGAGETFRGEGILAVTKALLQSGVSYVGGYQGAPISHLMDVLSDAQGVLEELGVHFEASASEAAAAAMLAASVNYPLRGAVTWKSTVGTNVASDALANVASSGVMGGALVIVGEDYGEGSSIMQERSHAFAMKSQMWLLDPRPDLPSIVAAVERGFELSEASNTPVMLELRIRACHVYGSFVAKNNVKPAFSLKDAMENPARDYSRVVLPPSNFVHEVEKIERRWPAAVEYISRMRLNEFLGGESGEIGIIVQGGLYNSLNRALELLGLSNAFGETAIPIYCLNVTYPLIEDEVRGFCLDKRAVLLIEEGQPEYIEHAVNSILRNADIQTRLIGKEVLPRAGEYTSGVLREGVRKFLAKHAPTLVIPENREAIYPGPRDVGAPLSHEVPALASLGRDDKQGPLAPPRPAGFCIGCPERPVFSAMKLVEKEIGKFHVSCDIGCHLFSILPPFDIGNTTTGYGLGWAGASAFGADAKQRTVAVMGDGGFWHNGLTSGVGNAVFNKSDNVLVIIDNGYSAATGGQDILSSRAGNKTKSTNNPIATAVKGVGVKWLREVNTYDVGRMKRTLKEAMTTKEKGPKVIIAQSECMLNRQRREKPQREKAIAGGKRVVRARYGVDPDTCTGDHACIRLSGCPSLTIRDNPDPLRDDPVAYVDNNCVGCGVCGENAHAAILCPSFYRAELIFNPNGWDKFVAGFRNTIISVLQRKDPFPAHPGQSRDPSSPAIAGEVSAKPTEGARAASDAHADGARPPPSVASLRTPPPQAGEERRAQAQPIKIAVMALGGQGGGVLADWIVAAGEKAGFIAQSTSVPGVAQRTGATIYYVELFPKAAAAEKGKRPVLALSPSPDDVDILIAAEMMEAARALDRGFLSDKTTLIASTHREYAIGEKIALADGRLDGAQIIDATSAAAKHAIFFDMERAADDAGAVISAVMFGALAASGAAPFGREVFAATIRASGRAVERNLKGFAHGYDAASLLPSPSGRGAGGEGSAAAFVREGEGVTLTPNPSPRGRGEQTPLSARIERLPEAVRAIAAEGARRAADFQDARYAALYLERGEKFVALDRTPYELSNAVAKHLALWMTYEDAIRVADLKTRKSRLERIRKDVRAADGQIMRVFEYMHPRVEEFCDLLPPFLARRILASPRARKIVGAMLGKGRRVPTTNITGFLMLRFIASLRALRRGGHRYRIEQARIEEWLSLIEREARRDYALAAELAKLQRLIKGYGETHERGLANFERIVGALDRVKAQASPAASLARLRDAALKDENGFALRAELSRLNLPEKAVA